MPKIFTEITPLSDNDIFYVVDRYKPGFDYPIHKHSEIELNFVSNCTGCQRVVGDSIETLGDYDLVLLGQNLEHGWLQNGVVQKSDIREITVQWGHIASDADFLCKRELTSLREMFAQINKGLAFNQEFIRSLLPKFEELVAPQPGFIRYMKLMEILYLMSVSNAWRPLSTTSFVNVADTSNSRRIKVVKDFIAKHYMDTLRLDDLAELVNMTPTAFSRFFKSRTAQTLSDYIIDIRIGHAIRQLVDTTMTSSEICYQCGFNNISNFNRLFRKKKGCSPMEFRENYVKTRIIV